MVANLRMWANFSPLVGKVEITGWNVHKLSNMLLQLLACVVRGCPIDQCLSGQSAQQELYALFADIWRTFFVCLRSGSGPIRILWGLALGAWPLSLCLVSSWGIDGPPIWCGPME